MSDGENISPAELAAALAAGKVKRLPARFAAPTPNASLNDSKAQAVIDALPELPKLTKGDYLKNYWAKARRRRAKG